MRLTTRGIAVLIAAAACAGFGFGLGYPLFQALAGLLAGAVLAALAATVRRPDVDVSRDVYPDRVERGRPALARLQVRNADGGFTARDRCGPHERTVVVRTDATYHYELPTGGRGKFTVGPLEIERTDPLGLAYNRIGTGDSAVLWVHPKAHPARPFSAGYRRHHHEGRTTDASPHGSLDLREVREYVPGDEVRLLHWKASARTGKLMVRDYADPDQPRFTLLLDTREEKAFEEVVEVAASLLRASALAGRHARLLTPGGVDVTVRGGALGARLLLDELCVLQPRRDDPLPPRPSGGLVVVTAGPLPGIAHLRPDVVFSMSGPGEVVGARVIWGPTADRAVKWWNEVAG